MLLRNLLLSAGFALGLGACAQAKVDPAPAPASNPLAGLASFTLADLQTASVDAHANADQAAFQCYDYLILALPGLVPNIQPGQTVGAVFAFQKARDLVAGATSQSGALKQLNLACAPLVNDVNVTLVKLGIIGAGVGTTGGTIAPLIPVIGTVLP